MMIARVIALIAIIATLGCSTLKPNWKWSKESKPQLPESVLPIWSDTVLHQPGKPGVRGFGGRVYFYAEEGGDPIQVDGSLSVYVFDGDQYDTTSSEPLRKFVITADQLASHHSESELGDSYSVWIPWDKVGGPSRSLSLIARFDGRNGGTAISDASNKLLPGSAKAKALQAEKNESQVRQVAFDDDKQDQGVSAGPDGSLSVKENRLKTYSLSLPPSFQRHIAGAQTVQPSREPVADSQPAPSTPPAASTSEVPTTKESEPARKSESEADSGRSKYPVRKTPMSQRVFAPRPSPRPRAEWRSGLSPTPRSPLATQETSPSELE
jgi:hypothetical protein